MLLTKNQERWIKSARRKYKYPLQFWRNLIKKQGGRCALTGALLLFDAKSGTSRKNGPGCHPLYASVDHIKPQLKDHGFQILCYDINDLKSHLPPALVNALTRTKEWQMFTKAWKRAAETSPRKRKVFKQLIVAGTPVPPPSKKTLPVLPKGAKR